MSNQMDPLSAENLTLVYSPGASDAAVYDGDGKLIDCGHSDDVTERLLDRLGVMIEYNGDFIADKTARGWGGVAKTLGEVIIR